MTPHPRAWIGIGVGLVGLAFALRPEAPLPGVVFFLVLILGVLPTVIGLVALVAERRNGQKRGKRQRGTGDKGGLIAVECDRISDALSDFVAEWMKRKPRGLFGNGEARLRPWREQMEARYHEKLRSWALEIFDAAVEMDGVSAHSRTFVDTPGHEHLHQLPKLFKDAARSLRLEAGA